MILALTILKQNDCLGFLMSTMSTRLAQKEAEQNMRPPSQPDSMDTDESKCLDL